MSLNATSNKQFNPLIETFTKKIKNLEIIQ